MRLKEREWYDLVQALEKLRLQMKKSRFPINFRAPKKRLMVAPY